MHWRSLKRGRATTSVDTIDGISIYHSIQTSACLQPGKRDFIWKIRLRVGLSTARILTEFEKDSLELKRRKVASDECGDVIESNVNGQRTSVVTVYVSPNSIAYRIVLFWQIDWCARPKRPSRLKNNVKKNSEPFR